MSDAAAAKEYPPVEPREQLVARQRAWMAERMVRELRAVGLTPLRLFVSKEPLCFASARAAGFDVLDREPTGWWAWAETDGPGGRRIQIATAHHTWWEPGCFHLGPWERAPTGDAFEEMPVPPAAAS